MRSPRKDFVVRMLTLIQRICFKIKKQKKKMKKIIKEYIIHLKKDGGILKYLRMSPNGRISEMADHCYQFIYKEHESERKFSESIKK